MAFGFGKGLVQKTIKTQLFRKVSGMNFLKDGEHCFSTSSSSSLISHGEFCIVLKESDYAGMYYDGDADAGKNFGYDEFRVEMSRSELLKNLDYIVVPNDWSDTEEGQDWIDNLADYGFVVSEDRFRSHEPNIRINFNF